MFQQRSCNNLWDVAIEYNIYIYVIIYNNNIYILYIPLFNITFQVKKIIAVVLVVIFCSDGLCCLIVVSTGQGHEWELAASKTFTPRHGKQDFIANNKKQDLC